MLKQNRFCIALFLLIVTSLSWASPLKPYYHFALQSIDRYEADSLGEWIFDTTITIKHREETDSLGNTLISLYRESSGGPILKFCYYSTSGELAYQRYSSHPHSNPKSPGRR